jgi:hypothetical protein
MIQIHVQVNVGDGARHPVRSAAYVSCVEGLEAIGAARGRRRKVGRPDSIGVFDLIRFIFPVLGGFNAKGASQALRAVPVSLDLGVGAVENAGKTQNKLKMENVNGRVGPGRTGLQGAVRMKTQESIEL